LEPTLCHHLRIVCTANSAVSWVSTRSARDVMPTLTQPALAARS
jgi:hypothetical protein